MSNRLPVEFEQGRLQQYLPRLSREVLVRQSRSQLQSTIEAHLRYDIDIKTGNICVVVPSKIADSTSKTFVFNLGTSNFISVPLDNRKTLQGSMNIVESSKDLESITLTEKYVLNTKSLGIFYFLHAIGIQKR